MLYTNDFLIGGLEMKRKRLLLLIGIFCLTGVLVGIPFLTYYSPEARAEDYKELQIGVILCMTGWFSSAGQLEKNECEVVTDLINEGGGINIGGQRYKIVLVFEDNKSSHEGTTAATNKLVYDRGIKFIAGPIAFWGKASGPICEANKVFNAIGFCTNTPGELDKSTQYRFLGNNATMGNTYGILQYIKKAHPEVKTVVALNPEDGSAKYLKPLFDKALKDNGISMVGDLIGYSLEMTDFTPIAQKIAQIKADAVFCPNGGGMHIGNLLKGMRELGDERWLFYSSVARCSELKSLAGKAAYKVTTGSVTPGAPGNAPQLEAFLNKYQQKYSEVKSTIFQTSSALYITPHLIEAAQSLDPTKVKDSLQNIDKVKTLWGVGRLCGEKTYGIRNHTVAHPYCVTFLDKDGNTQFGGWFNVDIQ
jgi:branched-chain amino acid transport system substrate-binding protein